METFTKPKEFVENPDYAKQRRQSLRELNLKEIDPPIVKIIQGLARLPHCFTLQSCYGHFLYDGMADDRNIAPLPESPIIESLEYRIAYLALCIEKSDAGTALFRDLARLTSIDPEYVQFGSAEWFWQRQINSYALQVEPKKLETEDRAVISYEEALHVEKIRDLFFSAMDVVLQDHLTKIA